MQHFTYKNRLLRTFTQKVRDIKKDQILIHISVMSFWCFFIFIFFLCTSSDEIRGHVRKIEFNDTTDVTESNTLYKYIVHILQIPPLQYFICNFTRWFRLYISLHFTIFLHLIIHFMCTPFNSKYLPFYLLFSAFSCNFFSHDNLFLSPQYIVIYTQYMLVIHTFMSIFLRNFVQGQKYFPKQKR